MQYAKQKRRRSLCQLRRPSIQLLALTVAMVARQASSLFVHVIHRGNSSSRYSAVSPGLYASNEDIQQQRQQSSSKTPITVPSWSDYFQALVKFRNECGHSHVPKRHTTTISATSLQFSDTPQIESSNIISIQLGAWVSRQRLRKDRLHADQISLLDSIGFCWNAHGDKDQKINEQWWKRFRDIQETRHQCLQTSTLQSLPPLEEGLSASQLAWLRRQRNDYVDYYQLRYTTTCKLNAEQLQALSELDPEWHMTPRERQWQTQFQALEEFQKENGHCNVPISHKNKKLANWVQTTRKKYKAIKLSKSQKQHHQQHLPSCNTKLLTKEQVAKLDEIGFEYDPWGCYS